MDLDRENNRFVNLKVEKTTIPKEILFFPDQVNMYYSHLESLSLVFWPVFKQDPIKDGARQIGIRRHSKMNLTEFGKFFVNACIPEGGFKYK
jgi:hypothetical protein